MRILHLINNLDYGGAEQVVAGLAICQSRLGHTVRVACLQNLGRQPINLEHLIKAGVKISEIGKPPGFNFRALRKLSAHLKEKQIDIVHTHNHPVHHYGAFAGRLAGCDAIINTLHGSASLRIQFWAKGLFWLSCITGHGVVSVCPQVHTAFRKAYHLPTRKLHIVDNGIDLSRFLTIPYSPSVRAVTFGNIGRFHPVKDHCNLLRAFAILKKRYPHVRLRLLGDGVLKHDMEKLAERLSVADSVHFEGFSLDTPRFLSGIDIYVISSLSEGLPLTLLEAMGAGRPVVTTGVGGIPEVLEKAHCGWLCLPSDSEALFRAMERALLAPDLGTIGARGRDIAVQRYSVERMAADYERLYENILANRTVSSTKLMRQTSHNSSVKQRTRIRKNALPSKIPGAVKSLGLSVLAATGALGLSQYMCSRNLLVLTYHRIVPREKIGSGARPSNTLFADEFERQMAYLSRHFNVLAGDHLRAIMNRPADIPRYSLAITFDDGYENNYMYALPILQRYGLKAVFFITTGLIGQKTLSFWFDRLDAILSQIPPAEVLEVLRKLDPALSVSRDAGIRSYFKSIPNAWQSKILERLDQHFGIPKSLLHNSALYRLMTWDQVRLLAEAGMTIGSHSVNHQILASVPSADANAEVVFSRRRIQEETGQECWCFSYPNGEPEDFRISDEWALQKAGYFCAFTQIPGAVSGDTPLFHLPRIPVPDTGNMSIFRAHLSGFHRTFRHILSV